MRINYCAKKNLNKTQNFSSALGFIWKYDDLVENKYVLQEGEVSVEIIKNDNYVNLYYPNYKITNYGNVINEKGEKVKLKDPDICPIYKFSHMGNTKEMQIHVLVAIFFIEGRTKEKNIVDHLDENRTNARYDNLEWVTVAENNKRASHKKKKSVKQIDICTGEVIKLFPSMIEAGRYIDENNSEAVSSGISKCCRGIRKTAYGFRWDLAR